MMRRGKWKCCYYHGEEPELFDLHDDPDEMRNLAGEACHKQVLDEMLGEMTKGWDPEKVEAEFTELKGKLAYIRSSPKEEAYLEKEYWVGPENYGSVNPV